MSDAPLIAVAQRPNNTNTPGCLHTTLDPGLGSKRDAPLLAAAQRQKNTTHQRWLFLTKYRSRTSLGDMRDASLHPRRGAEVAAMGGQA